MGMNSITLVREFRRLVKNYFSFLKDYRFERSSSDEKTTSTFSRIVFKGQYKAIAIGLDIRDLCVDVQVISVVNGHLKRRCEGGYSEDLFMYLVKHKAYRGRTAQEKEKTSSPQRENDIDKMVAEWADLLRTKGGSILDDKPFDNIPDTPPKASVNKKYLP